MTPVPHATDVRYARVPSRHGEWWMAWNRRGVLAVADDSWDERRFTTWVAAQAGAQPVPAGAAGAPAVVDWDSMPGGFRGAVLRACAAIPAGEVRTYGELAAAAGRPGAARAAGTAMATNPVPLLVPCHRVVRSDGRIGEYGAGGPSRKARMLAEEGVTLVDGRVAGRP